MERKDDRPVTHLVHSWLGNNNSPHICLSTAFLGITHTYISKLYCTTVQKQDAYLMVKEPSCTYVITHCKKDDDRNACFRGSNSSSIIHFLSCLLCTRWIVASFASRIERAGTVKLRLRDRMNTRYSVLHTTVKSSDSGLLLHQ